MSEPEKFFAHALIGACLMLIGLSIILACTNSMPRSRFESEAVKAGAAEYYLDSDNVRQFRWKKATP